MDTLTILIDFLFLSGMSFVLHAHNHCHVLDNVVQPWHNANFFFILFLTATPIVLSRVPQIDHV